MVEDTASSLLIDCETTQRISRNHMDMCRFTGNNDSEYKKVVHAIRNLAAHSLAILPKSPEIAALDKPKSTSPTLPAEIGLTEDEIAFAFIEKLKFPQIDSRKMGIRRAHSKTCQWLLDSRQYQDWLDDEKLHDHYGLLWMKGKPGTGKSTIMKFIDHKFRESQFGQHTVTISFFFNARGTELEKSTPGMYRALLVQLLTINSKLKSIFKQAGLERWNLLDENIWTLELLEVLFEKAVASLGDLSAVCFIDALDECDESQVRKMVRSLEHIVKTANLSGIKFRVFFSSRYYPQITTEVGLELLLDRQKGHDEDIEAYVESELRIGSCAIAAKIRDELKEKSQGIFMWVVLVTEMLSTEFDRGRHPRQLQQKLREIPNDLHQLYRSILMRDIRDQDELLLCLQWLLFAREPIAPQQFSLLMQVSGDADLSGGLEETSMAMIEKYIRNVSKGVAEVAKGYTVQFIHESVRDFLLKEDGLRDLWPDRTENPEGEGHDRLKQCCYHVLMFDLSSSPLCEEAMTSTAERIRRTAAVSLRDQARMRFSLLGYAVRNILQHSEEAESRNVDQRQFIQNFPLRRWTFYYYQFDKIRASRYTSQTGLLYVLAELGLSSLITKHTDPQACLTLEPGNFLTPLFAALASGPRSESTVKVLLEALSNQKGPNFPSTSWYEQWQSQGRIRFRVAETDKFPPALSIAAVPLETNSDILFEYPAHFSKGKDWIENSRHALIRAIMMGRADIVRLLLEGGCSPNYWRSRGGIRVAAAKGCDKTASLLPNSGADTKAKNYDEELSPLVLAARSGHTSVVSLLLERGCVKEPQALHLAAEEGHSDVVSFLLEQSYDANAVDLFGRTPLMLAARAGRTSTVSLLLGQGMGSDGQEAANRAVSINAACCGGRTALSYSVEAGFPETVSLLLENEHVDLNFADIKGRAALSYAAEKDCVDVVKLLIGSKGVELNLPDKAGRTPLSYAAQYGCLEVVRLLLGSRGVEIDLQDPLRRTPLSYTVSGRNSNVVEEMVQLFIRTGKVNVDASDYEGRTPLSYAAEADGNGTIVKILIDTAKIDLDKKDKEGQTALSHAAGSNRAKAVEL